MSSSWNYRVVRRVYLQGSPEEDSEYGFYEVYYTDGIPTGITQHAVAIVSDSLAELKWQLERLKEASEKPVLDYAEFTESELRRPQGQ